MLYAICAGDAIKFGYTSGSPSARLESLQCGNARKLVLVASWDGSLEDERHLHERFAEYRVHGEWFLPSDEVVAFVRSKRPKSGLGWWAVDLDVL